MELFTPEVGLIFWMLVAFLIVFFVLAKYAWPFIIKGVEERKAFIDNSLESAKAANERLEGIREECDRMLSLTREEELRTLKNANEMRNKIVAEAKEQATVEAGKLIAEARLAIQKEKKKALRDIHNELVTLSIDIAEKVLRKQLDDQPAQRELVNRLLEEAQKN
ncbi:MAG: F0F1 ATP synthase subunit B [Dysgonamonadaceae bacterium]|jgi:F-type H+-transporting ATPase subunit b|nr:F0F1 ATP synthase subunit B [Dysgonamonadaceae bacterium]